MNSTPQNSAAQAQPLYPSAPPAAAPVPKPEENYIYSPRERRLLILATALSVAFDRLVIAPRWSQHWPFAAMFFWLFYYVAVYVFFWKELKKNKLLWFISGASALLCMQNFIFDYQSYFGILSCSVLPAVAMAHALFIGGRFTLKNAAAFCVEWLSGWVVKPFSAISKSIGAASITGDKKKLISKIVVSLAILTPLLMVIVSMLANADKVFGYFVDSFLSTIRLPAIFSHSLVIAIGALLLYSFFWNAAFRQDAKPRAFAPLQLDATISTIVLTAVVLVYLLFCAVQFTYLFAKAGLPIHMTYSEYAREGFAQIVCICAINLVLFGLFLKLGTAYRHIFILEGVLLGVTGIMALSSLLRLKLYIDTYGLTWLRLLSLWFIIYLFAVIALCAVRMLKPKLPLIAVCSFVLLSWYVALGYSNPDALVIKHNLSANNYSAQWVMENEEYIFSLSDNALLVFMQSDVDPATKAAVLQNHSPSTNYSVSSRIAQQMHREYLEQSQVDTN